MRRNPSPLFSLYDLVGHNGTVLYVGATRSLDTRLRQHRGDKEWWPEVDHVHVVECADLADLHERERQRIKALQPRYNKQHRDTGDALLESTELFPIYDVRLADRSPAEQEAFHKRAAEVVARLYTDGAA